jgi:hypothetical protein
MVQGSLIPAQDQILFGVWMEGENNWNFMSEVDAMGIHTPGNISSFP